MTTTQQHSSSLDDLLAEDGLLEDATLAATKKVIAAQIADAMKRRGLTKTAMAAEMKTTRAQLDRLLDPANDSVTLATLKRAVKALGKTLKLELALKNGMKTVSQSDRYPPIYSVGRAAWGQKCAPLDPRCAPASARLVERVAPPFKAT